MALTLTSIYEHPLKSGRGNLVPAAEVRSEGLALDRRFLVHTADGTFVSGRSHPRLVLINVEWDDSILFLTAPGMPDFELLPSSDAPSSVAVWKDRFSAWDQGDDAAAWLSQFLSDDLRLAWLGESQRPLRWDRDRAVTFADAAPLLAIGAASLADLSQRVGENLSMRRFRPNLVISGAEPYEEDSWRRLRIGGLEFLNLDGCGRCEFTTIDPETAERHPRNEPVATLESFRKADTGIYFGMNLMPLSTGILRVGDTVTVLDRRRPLTFTGFSFFPEPRGIRWPEGASALRCTAVRDEAPGVRTFHLEREDGQNLTWDAGQYLTLKFHLPEGLIRRSYSLSSAPGSGLEITVKRLHDGRASRWLYDHLVPGGTVLGEMIGGSFTLREHPWGSLLLLGAGSGVTPLISMLRWIAAEDLPVDVAFHQTARTATDLLFTDELARLKEILGDRLTLGHRLTATEGRWDHQGLVKFCPDLRDRRAFVCGPNGYRAATRALLSGAGFKVDRRYHEELFGEAALEVPEAAMPGTVTFSKTAKTVASDGRTTVLQLAERSGIDLPSSCRSGDCGTCRVKAGSEWVLACHTFPQGDLLVEI